MGQRKEGGAQPKLSSYGAWFMPPPASANREQKGISKALKKV